MGWLLIVLAVVIVLGLSVYAGMLLSQLHKQRTEERAGEAKRLNYLHESIATIALAMQQGQCPLSEGCIRIAVLLDNLPNAEQQAFPSQFPYLHDMYNKIKHMPTHDARKQFPKQEIRKMDKEREGLEIALEQDIQADVVKIIAWVKEARSAG